MSDAPLVLNVDDYESGRYARGTVLRQAGFRVVDASTADEALRMLANELPAVALVDVQLPDMNGSELCRRIKANPATASVLVVHTSATFRRGEDWARGLDQGADAYLVEPVEPEVLVATVRALLRTRRAEDAVRLAEREWRLTFEAISDGACFVDREGLISRCNARFGALVGGEGQLTGRPVQSVFGALLGDLPADAVHGSWTRDIQVGSRWLRVVVTPVPAEVTGTAGGVWIVTDITEHKRVEEMTARLLAVEADGTERLVGEYIFNHTRTIPGPPGWGAS
jgi:PAS domain S-box-containing protein